MIIYPAIDLRQGRCVRLQQGRKDQETVYGEDPVLVARRWAEEGAEWLHVVNLDGAFQDQVAIPDRLTNGALPPNLRALQAIATTAPLPIQFGGGLRSWTDIVRVFELGARRVILGTVALENPELLAQALAWYGAERMAVGLDARDGWIVTHGWLKTTTLQAWELGLRMREMGVGRVVHTDVARDGMLAGANVTASVELARRTGLRVIVSGGVATLEEIRQLREHVGEGIEGAIIGRALYTGDIRLADAIQAGKGL